MGHDLAIVFRDFSRSQGISFVHAKSLIIEALDRFDAELGQSARDLLNDGKRLNLREVPEGEAQMMRVRPARLEPGDAMNLEDSKLMPAQIEKIREFFPSDSNEDGEKAVIDYEYDGTMNGVIYLAHELGHALADDCQRDAGLTYRDNPPEIAEIQAYFLQNIVYDDLMAHKDPAIAKSARQAFTQEMTGFINEQAQIDHPAASGTSGRPQEFLTARGLMIAEKNMAMLGTLYGAEEAPSLEKTLKLAGFETVSEPVSLACETFRSQKDIQSSHAPAPVPRNAAPTI